MLEFEKPEIISLIEDENNNYGKFVCEPLERGYGITLGNSLRRVLLSSLPGAAIAGIEIEGVQHEFTTIPNVVEDVTEIILNLKSVRFRIEDGSTTKKITLTKKGEGPVYAGDIHTTSGIEVLNKDLLLFTASKGANVHMTLTVKTGRGYNTVEDNRKNMDDKNINYIAIDSIFTPVKKVNYQVENTRVGDRVDYDKLIIEVWTDGSLTPKETLGLAAKVMTTHLQIFMDLTDIAENLTVMAGDAPKVDENEILSTKIEDLGLNKRPLNCLKIKEIHTLKDLVSYTRDEVSKFKNLGSKSLQEVVDKVYELGFDFKKEEDREKELQEQEQEKED